MEGFRQEIILSSVVIYMVFCIVVGLWAMRRTHSPRDFFIAGRRLGPLVVAFGDLFPAPSVALALLAVPDWFYAQGVSSFWMIIFVYHRVCAGFLLSGQAHSNGGRASRCDVAAGHCCGSLQE